MAKKIEHLISKLLENLFVAGFPPATLKLRRTTVSEVHTAGESEGTSDADSPTKAGCISDTEWENGKWVIL